MFLDVIQPCMYVLFQGWYLPTMPSDDFEMIANVRPSNGSAFAPHSKI